MSTIAVVFSFTLFAATPPITAPSTNPADSVAAILSQARDAIKQSKGPEGLQLFSEKDGQLQTEQSFQVPVQINIVAKTDSSNIRLFYGPKGVVTFDWKQNADLLLINDPVTGADRRQKTGGNIPANKFVKITWIIGEMSMLLLVDDVERAVVPTQCRGLIAPVGIGPGQGSTLTIQSIRIRGAHNASAASIGAPANWQPTRRLPGGESSVVPPVPPAEAVRAVLDMPVGEMNVNDDENGLRFTTNADGRLLTKRTFATPLHVEFLAMTDSTNLVVYLGKGHAVFNPAKEPASLFYNDPMTGVSATYRGAGHVPPNRFTRITWDLNEKSSSIAINGTDRVTTPCDAKDFNDHLGIGPSDGSSIVVKSVYIRDGSGAIIDSNRLPTSPATAASNPATEASATQPITKALVAKYIPPNADAAPFDAEHLSISEDQRHALADALAGDVRKLPFVEVRETASDTNAPLWKTAARFLGVALVCDPDNREAIVVNAELTLGKIPKLRAATQSSSEPSTQPDPLPALASACLAGKSKDDQTLAAELFDLILVEDPANEDAIYQIEMLAKAGTKPNWDWADNVASTAAPATQANFKKLAKRQSSIKGLGIFIRPDRERSGVTSDVIVSAVSDGQQHEAPRFSRDAGADAQASLDVAVRAVHVRYPHWENSDIQFTCEDRYAKQAGRSAGGAFATLLMSLLDGFEIDPDVAIAADITEDGKLRRVGAVEAKIRAAALRKIPYVIVPAENTDSLDDYAVLYGEEAFWETQILTADTLDAAIALARKDRDPTAAESIKSFNAIATECQMTHGSCLARPDIKAKLDQIATSLPSNQSARFLRAAADRKLPTHLSPGMTLYRILHTIRPFQGELWESKKPDETRYATSQANAIRAELGSLKKIADPSMASLMIAVSDFVNAVPHANTPADLKVLNERRMAVITELSKRDASRDTLEQLQKGV